MTQQQTSQFCYLLDGMGAGSRLPEYQLDPEHHVLLPTVADKQFFWIHLDYSQTSSQHWLANLPDLDPVICENLQAEETRPRVFASKGSLFVVLRGVNTNPGADPEDMVSIRLWIHNKGVISSSKRNLLSVLDMSNDIDKGRGPDTPGEFITRITGKLIDRMFRVVEDINEKIDSYQEAVMGHETHELSPLLADLRRRIIALRRYLAPQREVLNRLCQENVDWLNPGDRISLRETTDTLTRYLEDLDSATARANITQEQLANRLAEQIGQRMYVFSLVALIFLPLSFATGLLGINVGGIPGATNNQAFLLVCLILVVVLAAQLIFFKIKRWL